MQMFGKKKKLDIQIDPKKEYGCELKLLILGCSHSGKTTIMRHLQLITDDTTIDKKNSQRVIYGNTVDTVVQLLNLTDKLGLQVADENKERVERVKTLSRNTPEFRQSRFPLQVVYDFSCIWKDDAIQSAFEHALRTPEDSIVGRPQYYMENIFRIFSPDFKPEEIDVLSAYEQGEQNADVIYRKVKLLTQCPPGDTTDTRKWSTLEGAPDVIMFTVNLSNFDNANAPQYLKYSLDTIEHISQNWQPFSKAPCAILLNYKDLFLKKAATQDLQCCFPEYDGGLDSEKALAYVTQLFSAKCNGPTQRVYTVNSLDKKTVTTVLDDLFEILAPEISKRTIDTCNNNNNGKQASPRSPREAPRDLSISKEVQKEKEKVDKQKKKVKRIASLESGFESVQGRRKTMEDTHVIIDDFRPQFPGYGSVAGQCGYFGVYDGHGGGETSKIVEQILHKNLLEDPLFVGGEYEAGLKSAFAATDGHIVQQPAKSGSTAVVATIIGNHLCVANAGDSEAILGRLNGVGKKSKCEHVVLTEKHIPTNEQEKQRITAAGGLVVFGRLFGSLAVSRSFGDKDYKDGAHFVSAEPFIFQQELTPQDQFIVMACDGLWDKLGYEDVINTVTRLRKEGKSSTDIAKALVAEALEKDSMDNITVIVVFINWKK